jgi:hypothetical protein
MTKSKIDKNENDTMYYQEGKSPPKNMLKLNLDTKNIDSNSKQNYNMDSKSRQNNLLKAKTFTSKKKKAIRMSKDDFY